MTEIVDERQRLVARLRKLANIELRHWTYDEVNAAFAEAADRIEADGKRMKLQAGMLEMWSPQYDDLANKFSAACARVAELEDGLRHIIKAQDDWQAAPAANGWQDHILPSLAQARALLASRPQEQPRKLASGGLKKRLRQHATELRDAVRDGNCTPDLNDEYLDNAADLDDAVAALEASVSPAAAQGWQTVPLEATEAMLRAATMIAPTWDDAASRAKYAAMLAAAPPSPAAQEQEKKTTCEFCGAGPCTRAKRVRRGKHITWTFPTNGLCIDRSMDAEFDSDDPAHPQDNP